MGQIKSKDGSTIYFERHGDGPPLILVDGALCSSSFGPMPGLVPLLAEQFTVFVYDRRGRGKSEDQSPYNIEREVEDLDALINEAGGAACVFGMSSGGILSLQAAASGCNIKKLAIYEPPICVDKEEHQIANTNVKELQKLIESEKRTEAVKYFLKEAVEMHALVVFMMRWLPVWKQMKAVAHTLPYDASITAKWPLSVLTDTNIDVPLYILGGEKSSESLHRSVHSLTDAIPHARSRMLEGQSHNVKPKVLVPELTNFLKSKLEERR